MNPALKTSLAHRRLSRQRGVVLFFALIALLAMSLAAVGLIRSVDTNTMIAGNLSFRRAATTSADAGIEAAITWLAATDAANLASGINVLMDPGHPFNNTGGVAGFLNPGYYSNMDPTVSVTSGAGVITWGDGNSKLVVAADGAGNQIRYVIQRMCRAANTTVSATDCLFSGAVQNNNQQNIPLPQNICNGPGCPVAGQTPQYRITSRSSGPRSTITYVQAFVY